MHTIEHTFQDVTESALKSARRKCEIERSSVWTAMIEAGRGHELSSETLKKATLPDADALTLRFAAISTQFMAVIAEEQRRMTWHGSLKRISPAGASRRFAGFNP